MSVLNECCMISMNIVKSLWHGPCKALYRSWGDQVDHAPKIGQRDGQGPNWWWLT